MKQDFSELVEYLDKKFQETASKQDIARLEGRIEGLDRAITTVDERVDHLEHSFEDLRGDFRNLQIAIDAYAYKADTYFQEMVLLSRKVDRLERWIHQVAEKVGIDLKVE
ncbi:MAG: hypothetical protein HY434_00060 [Candidatus Liptonbacteria bacterium]|nr:hypothetical protein [Candidatus Liptonbacteria bacterium]